MMICRCGPNAADAQKMRDKVDSLLGSSESDLLTRVVVSLNWDYDAHITGIANDQWSGVYAATYAPKGEEPEFRTSIECDWVEDGIAATWLAFYEKYGERREA